MRRMNGFSLELAIVSRSPCPGLNAIANHGYLPRDGENISLEILTKALNETANLHSSLSEFLGDLALKLSTTGDPKTFHLNDIAAHGDFIEHDASLSRADAYFGDNLSFNKTIWAGSKSILFAQDPIPLASFSKARAARFKASMAGNPEFHVTEDQKSGSLLEMATISKLFRINNTTEASSEWIRVLFGQ
ncbi:sterigmatocystin biosynthesis peroxidase stcc (chloroperoxidase) [Colletotrichum tofieldiae]|uniref:Sterigmatocystin biosynthesis peroxidase stcc (Chloroperoxidase) n=1 Tax=Colletotrichum tofieldiae TaxID=708197 RepID=A0A166XFC4_9PEZI|nr:sterigmatocystin biosynthesis peroxidase stcc (chloroperoxidase) [Colletotrichum tofieldiae]